MHSSLLSKSQSLATLSPTVSREKIPVPVNILKEETRKMNSRICTWNVAQLGDDLLECILFRKHVKKICPSADHILNPFWVQEVLEFNSIHMAICLHLEGKVADVAEAETAVPP
jgi:hypothetical protein